MPINFARAVCAAAVAGATLALMPMLETGKAWAQTSHKMRIAHAYPEHTQHGRNMEILKKKVEEYTNGRVAVTIYANSQLGPITQEISMVLVGTVDASYNIGGIVEGIDPAEAIWNIPFLLKVAPGQGEHMWRVMNDKTVTEILAKRQAAKGLKRFGNIPTLNGFMLVGNNKRPVEKLEDLKGLRIRHPGGLMGELYISSLGGSPMTVAGAEVPVALQQGVVDGLVTTPVHYHDARWHTKYMTLPFYAGYSVPLVASLRWWQSLPEDIRDIIENKVIPEVKKEAYTAVSDLEKRYIEEMQKPPYNVQISWVQPDEMERFAQEVREKGIARFIEKVGPEGKTLVERVQDLGKDITIQQ